MHMKAQDFQVLEKILISFTKKTMSPDSLTLFSLAVDANHVLVISYGILVFL